MRKRLHESRCFRLQQETNRKGRKFYRIVWFNWIDLHDQDEQLRDLIDPHRNKSGKHGSSWKFSNLKEAEQMYSILLLRWS
jgi:plasmid replication initiation protein